MKRKLYHGSAYYPELWDEKTIHQDIEYMKSIGLNVVRMGEFLWSKLEPEENRIDIRYLKEIMDLLYANGIEIVLGTPTATPPIWMSYGHPERMHVNENGQVMHHGARQHVCTNNPYMREKSRIIIEKIAQTVGRHPGLVGWQLDNEFKCHVQECMCATCNDLWHQWLAKRYGTVDNLNEKWGTDIWSEFYQSFDQIPQPLATPFLHNPSLTTAYQTFTMEKLTEYANLQIAAIRKYSQAPITHNGSFGFLVDNEQLYRNMDEAAFDTYAAADNYPGYLMCLDFWRNVKKGKSFWLMETSTSHNGNTQGFAKSHPAGYLEAEALAAYALGSKSFMYWLWRQQRTGCEITHGAVLSAWGKPTIGFHAVLEVEKMRRTIEPLILNSQIRQAEVAITYSDRSKAFFLSEKHHDLEYRSLMQEFYSQALHAGVDRDLILEGEPFDDYKVLMTPYMPSITPTYLKRARDFVQRGGIWIVGPHSGGRTEEHTVPTDAGLGKLESIAGVETVYTYPMDGTGAIGNAFGMKAPLHRWSAVFRCREAKCMGWVEGGASPEMAFITERQVGKGKIVLVGSEPAGEAGQKMLRTLIKYYATEAGVLGMTDVTPGTLVAKRTGADGDIWFVINLNGQGGSVTLPKEARDCLDGDPVAPGCLSVRPYQYRIVKFV